MNADGAVPARAARGRRSRRTSGDEREAAILATAERLLGQHPLRRISVDDLARGAGISRPTFYFYFPSKEAVVLTLLDRVEEQARATRRQALAGVADPPERWRRLLAATEETFTANRSLTLAAAQLLSESTEARAVWGRVIDSVVEDTAQAIEAERARGAAPDQVDARDLATALVWMSERVLFTAIAGQQPALPPGAAVDVLLRVWLAAIYAPADSHPPAVSLDVSPPSVR